MLKYSFLLGLICCCITLNAQVRNDTVDYKYFEDQLYVSFSYNIAHDRPDIVSSNLFSGSFSLGYIRDIPFNERRNFGLGIGLGYNYNNYNKNIRLGDENGSNEVQISDDYLKNRFILNRLEIPFEIRWRTSTPVKYKFWRVYGGLKISYLVASKYKFRDDTQTIVKKNIAVFNKFNYGFILSVGFSTWNIFAYYGMSPLFKDVTLEGEELSIKDFNVGLKFYIL